MVYGPALVCREGVLLISAHTKAGDRAVTQITVQKKVWGGIYYEHAVAQWGKKESAHSFIPTPPPPPSLFLRRTEFGGGRSAKECLIRCLRRGARAGLDLPVVLDLC